jgi:hypothetical protein
MPRKLLNIGWGRSKYIRLKNLTVYLWMIKELLVKKIQFKKENSKLDV